MTYSSLHSFIFSPTGTSRKIAQAVAHGFNAPQITTSDLTHQCAVPTTLPTQAVALFTAPVYGGKVAPAALKRIEEVRGDSTPAIVIVVYGNRAFGKAAVELAEAVKSRGFIPIATAAFIGEHSYSTLNTPIAIERPDTNDIIEAQAWGAHIATLLATHGVSEVDARKLKQPSSGILSILRFVWFAMGYMRDQKRNPVVRHPLTSDACTRCGLCVKLCPTQAITPGDETHTDASHCIRCCACVKGCPSHARSYYTPFASILSRNFARPKPNTTL